MSADASVSSTTEHSVGSVSSTATPVHQDASAGGEPSGAHGTLPGGAYLAIAPTQRVQSSDEARRAEQNKQAATVKYFSRLSEAEWDHVTNSITFARFLQLRWRACERLPYGCSAGDRHPCVVASVGKHEFGPTCRAGQPDHAAEAVACGSRGRVFRHSRRACAVAYIPVARRGPYDGASPHIRVPSTWGRVPCVCQSCFASMHTQRLVEAPVAVSASVCVGVDVCLRAYACVQVVGAARAHARRESLRTYPTVNKTILYSESYPSTVIEVCARLVRRESRYKGVTVAGRMSSPYGRCRTASLWR